MIEQHAAQNKSPPVNDPGRMTEHTREQIKFDDNIVKTLPSAMLDILKRIHINLGHPSGPDMVRYLTLCGASADSLLGARVFRFNNMPET